MVCVPQISDVPLDLLRVGWAQSKTQAAVLVDNRRADKKTEHRHFVCVGHAHIFRIGRRAREKAGRENLVFERSVETRHRFLRFISIIASNQLKFASVDAAMLIDVVEKCRYSVANGRTAPAEFAGKGQPRTNHNFRISHTNLFTFGTIGGGKGGTATSSGDDGHRRCSYGCNKFRQKTAPWLISKLH